MLSPRNIGQSRTSLLLLVGLLCHGCATVQPKTHYDVEIDSIQNPDSKVNGKNYYLIPLTGQKGGASELEYKEFSKYLEKILMDKGFTRMSNATEADQVVFLVVGITEGIAQDYTYSVPTYGQTGVSSSHTTGSVGGYGNYSATTTYTPTYGVTGSRTYSGTDVSYGRIITIRGIESNKTGTPRTTPGTSTIWQTSVVSIGSSNDLRLVVPYMMYAMRPYITTNTGHKLKMSVQEDDPGVSALRGEPAMPPTPAELPKP